jgi:O-acetyl-ADP-ribose deacetylase (regulator of RNase III)
MSSSKGFGKNGRVPGEVRGMKIEYRGRTVELKQGDITRVAAGAIVNAANEGLMGGGGVDGAIHRSGGPAIIAECRKLGGCRTGSAVLTTAGNLPAAFVIHAVGPVWRGGNHNEEALLWNAYSTSLKIASVRRISSIAFPSISTGAYGYPVEQASRVALRAVLDHLEGLTSIRHVTFVLFSARDYAVYEEALSEVLGSRA